jgi:glucosamine kinase
MIIIADSGSTNTTWNIVDETSRKAESITASGINPLYQTEESILSLLNEEFTPGLIPERIYFYGAGCINPSVNTIVVHALQQYFHCNHVEVESDLVAAARALCQRNAGIACILGTGSNSCYYDGSEIVRHVSPLGFMLGDEGSGAVLGKKLVADVLKNQMPADITAAFFNRYAYTAHEIIENVYKRTFPNRFLAQFTLFIQEHMDEEPIRNLLTSGFTDFFNRNIRQYPEANTMPVHFTGSIAFHFQEILKETAAGLGYKTGIITASPNEGLIRYHLS